MIFQTRRIMRYAGVVISVFVLFFFYCQWRIIFPARDLITDTIRVSSSTAIVVFGGGMKNQTEQSDMQYDRVRKGVELWQTSSSSTLWFTGDDGAWRGNEIMAMVALAQSLGVPTSSIATDPHGYRTIFSCRRLAQEYGIDSMVAVSQQFHLYRIIFLCRHFGIDAIGVVADLRPYTRGWIVEGPREWLARVKAIVEVLFISLRV